MNCVFCKKLVLRPEVLFHAACYDRNNNQPQTQSFGRAEVAKHLGWLHAYSAKPSFILTLLDRQMIHKAAEMLREEQKPT